MDFGGDDGDDHHHPYRGCDPACACSDRFSWLLFHQPLSFAAAPMPPFLLTEFVVLTKHRPRRPVHCQMNRRQTQPCNPQRDLSNAALTLGFTVVLQTPRYARDCSVPMRARPMNVSV
jgi:hypothetical protein